MKTVFLGGSRKISRLNAVIRERLDNVVERGMRVVVGDANGADRAFQQYFAERDYRNVVVYFMKGHCRNNVGGWPVEAVEAEPGKTRGFEFYSTKDRRMAAAADYGFMLWDGESKGTLNNMIVLLDAAKPVWLYFSKDHAMQALMNRGDLDALVGRCPDALRAKIRELSRELSLVKECQLQLPLHG
jgi:hypothetical protein